MRVLVWASILIGGLSAARAVGQSGAGAGGDTLRNPQRVTAAQLKERARSTLVEIEAQKARALNDSLEAEAYSNLATAAIAQSPADLDQRVDISELDVPAGISKRLAGQTNPTKLDLLQALDETHRWDEKARNFADDPQSTKPIREMTPEELSIFTTNLGDDSRETAAYDSLKKEYETAQSIVSQPGKAEELAASLAQVDDRRVSRPNEAEKARLEQEDAAALGFAPVSTEQAQAVVERQAAQGLAGLPESHDLEAWWGPQTEQTQFEWPPDTGDVNISPSQDDLNLFWPEGKDSLFPSDGGLIERPQGQQPPPEQLPPEQLPPQQGTEEPLSEPSGLPADPFAADQG